MDQGPAHSVARRALLGMGLALPALAGCSAFGKPSATKTTERLRIVTAKEIARIGVSGGGGSETSNVVMLIFDTLVTLDNELGVAPRLAVSWEQVSETDWRFKLREGVRFSNGELLDAEAVAQAIHHITSLVPGYTYRNQWGEAWPPRARVIDPLQVEISTPTPQPALPRLMCRLCITPPLATQMPMYANNPIGSGPYKIKSWKRGRRLVLQANEDHFDGAPRIRELVWSSTPNAAARVIALQSHDADLIWDVPLERIKLVDDSPGLKVLEYQSIGLAFVTFNFKEEGSPIRDPRVRKAMTYAIDSRHIRDTLLDGRGELPLGPAPAQVIGSVDAGGYPDRDVAKARRLLSEAGYPDGIDLNFIFQTGIFQYDEDVCGALVAQLAEAGVRVRFEDVPPGAMIERQSKPGWDLCPNSVPGSFTGEATYHYYQLKAQQGYHSQPVETLLNAANRSGGEARTDLIKQAMSVMWADTPYLWSLGMQRNFGTIGSLEGLGYIPINWLDFSRAKI